MSSRLRTITLVLAVTWMPAVVAADRDPYFSEALFWASQGLYFDALERLDAELAQHFGVDEPELDSLHPFIEDAKFSVGDFELGYRMHLRAGHAIGAVLEGSVDESVRNEAAFRLARIHYQKGQLVDALQALERIHGRVPDDIRDDLEYLRANVFLSTARPDEAATILRQVQGSRSLRGFADYNLAIAYLQSQKTDDALQQLDRAGAIEASDDATLAIRDRANLVRGTLLLEAGRYADADAALERVRLDGPFSNQALLSAGWARVSSGQYERALVPWKLLVERNRTDPSVQEAMLALPYTYAQLEVHGRAAVLYGDALRSYGAEMERLDVSIESIRAGKFLEALVREEIRKDRDWVMRLRELPETPETYYLMALMASHEFQSGLSNYLDLEDLRKRLDRWQGSFDAYEDLLEVRRAYYEPLLPGVDRQFQALDSQRRLRMEQHALLAKRLQSMLTAPRPEFLATTGERLINARLSFMSSMLDPESDAPLVTRIGRLQGLIVWNTRTEYHDRLTRFYEDLDESQQAIDQLTVQYNAYVRTRQAATHSYQGYDEPIKHLRQRVKEARETVDLLMARQGHVLEQVAIRELKIRARRIEGYQERARYALADSYDRATQAQSRQGGGG